MGTRGHLQQTWGYGDIIFLRIFPLRVNPVVSQRGGGRPLDDQSLDVEVCSGTRQTPSTLPEADKRLSGIEVMSMIRKGQVKGVE